MMTLISVIIPAYNAADTLEFTLDSVFNQIYTHWEIIVVDDGSTDQTLALTTTLAQSHLQLHVLTQVNQGVSAARNTGAAQATGDWLLFLDADDWIAPDYLSKLVDVISDQPNLDVVHCGWVRVAADGTQFDENRPSPQPDLFPILAQQCLFTIHSCLVRRSTFWTSGGFDRSLKTCEDWDLWQRLARQGCQFGGIPDLLAFYRMQAGSLSGNGIQFFQDGLKVLNQGYAPDPRVTHPVPAYANGLPSEALSTCQFYWAIWPLGLVLGAGLDAKPLLQQLSNSAPSLDPDQVAHNLFKSMPIATQSLPSQWFQIWQQRSALIKSFLGELECRSQAPALALRAIRQLERLIINATPLEQLPLALGYTYGVRLEVTHPITSMKLPSGLDRLIGQVEVQGHYLGSLERPACGEWVSEQVIKDGIADQFWWQILGHFYQQTVYPVGANHNQLGWVTFLRDLWNWPSGVERDFYLSTQVDPKAPHIQVDDNLIRVEVSEVLATYHAAGPSLSILVTVGGVGISYLACLGRPLQLSASDLRRAITTLLGIELGKVAVREALVGQCWSHVSSLRSRLMDQASQTNGSSLLENRSQTLVLGRRDQPIGTSSCRWALLPASVAYQLKTMAHQTGESIIYNPDQTVESIVYAPEVSWGTPQVFSLNSLLATEPFWLSLQRRASQWVQAMLSRIHQSDHRLKRWFAPYTTTAYLPILSYHRISPTGSSHLGVLSPEVFEQQLKYLRESGYRSIDLSTWQQALLTQSPVAGKAIILSFDHGFQDFFTYAYPLLQQYGYSATVFIATDYVGQRYQSSLSSDQISYMTWEQIQALQAADFEFGSAMASYRPLTALSIADIVAELAQSRGLLSQALGRSVQAAVYPHGETDSALAHLAGACGYTVAVSGQIAFSQLSDSLLALPRLAIAKHDTLEMFISKLRVFW